MHGSEGLRGLIISSHLSVYLTKINVNNLEVLILIQIWVLVEMFSTWILWSCLCIRMHISRAWLLFVSRSLLSQCQGHCYPLYQGNSTSYYTYLLYICDYYCQSQWNFLSRSLLTVKVLIEVTVSVSLNYLQCLL